MLCLSSSTASFTNRPECDQCALLKIIVFSPKLRDQRKDSNICDKRLPLTMIKKDREP